MRQRRVVMISSVKIISMPDRDDRRQALFANLRATGVFDGIRKDIFTPRNPPATPPDGWPHGIRVWDNLTSHLGLIEDIDANGGPVVILEDDAFFVDGSPAIINQLLAESPDGWGQIYLGGRHTERRKPANGRVFKCRRVVRSHAYIVHPERAALIAEFIRASFGKGLPIDEIFAEAHFTGAWLAYCPEWWICGQRPGMSDLTGTHRPERL